MVVKTWGTPREEPELLNHVDLVAKLGIADLEKGVAVAGATPCRQAVNRSPARLLVYRGIMTCGRVES